MDYNAELVSQLFEIKKRFGFEIFLNSSRCSSIYGDLYPEMAQNRRLLEMVLTTPLVAKLSTPISSIELRTSAYKAYEEVVGRYFVDAHDAALIVNSIIKLFNHNEFLDVPEKATKEQLYQIEPYKFLGRTYSDLIQLLSALGKEWEQGKQELRKSGMIDYYKKSRNKDFYNRINRAHNNLCVLRDKSDIAADILFCGFLYDGIGPKEFIWKGTVYSSLENYISDLNRRLREDDDGILMEYGQLLLKKTYSNYLRFQSGISTEKIARIEECELLYSKEKTDAKKKEIIARLGVELIDQKFEYNGRFVSQPTEILNDILTAAGTGDRSNLDSISNNVMHEGKVDIVFSAWLKALHFDGELEAF